jgi:hypothetical protein
MTLSLEIHSHRLPSPKNPLASDPLARTNFQEPGDSSARKSTVCGITGLLSYPSLPAGPLANYILDPSPQSSRLFPPRSFFRRPLRLAFASKRTICNSIFSCS